MSKNYVPRLADELLKLHLESSGAVLIEGAKWCGKTTCARQAVKSIADLGDPDKEDEYLAMADIAPSKILEGERPRLIDEWQRIPKLWDSVRVQVDRLGGFGHFVLTGSASPLRRDEDKRRHSGTGRISRLLMYPFTLLESGDSDGSVSLRKLFAGEGEIDGFNPIDIDRLAFLCCRGGWPAVCCAGNISDRAALMAAKSYVDAICSREVDMTDDVVFDSHKMRQFLRSYARMTGSQQPVSQMVRDIPSSFSEKTAYSYNSLLKRIFAVDDMSAWNVNLRSRTAVRTSDTHYFCDPSIAAAALGIGPGDLINDLKTFGFIFENLCVRDLRVYSSVLGGTVFHYRDKSDLECDAVVHLENGKFGLIEIKLGGKEAIEYAAKTLKELEGRIDKEKMGSPSFLMVLTGVGSYAWRREDGVFVVPVSTLGV